MTPAAITATKVLDKHFLEMWNSPTSEQGSLGLWSTGVTQKLWDEVTFPHSDRDVSCAGGALFSFPHFSPQWQLQAPGPAPRVSSAAHCS